MTASPTSCFYFYFYFYFLLLLLKKISTKVKNTLFNFSINLTLTFRYSPVSDIFHKKNILVRFMESSGFWIKHLIKYYKNNIKMNTKVMKWTRLKYI